MKYYVITTGKGKLIVVRAFSIANALTRYSLKFQGDGVASIVEADLALNV